MGHPSTNAENKMYVQGDIADTAVIILQTIKCSIVEKRTSL